MDIIEIKSDMAKDMDELNKIEDELIKLNEGAGAGSSDAIAKRRTVLHNRVAQLSTKLEKMENALRAVEASC